MPSHTSSPTQDCRGLWRAIVDCCVPSHEYANLFRGHPSELPYPTLHLTFTACQCHPHWLFWPVLTKCQNTLLAMSSRLWQIFLCVLLTQGLSMVSHCNLFVMPWHSGLSPLQLYKIKFNYWLRHLAFRVYCFPFW